MTKLQIFEGGVEQRRRSLERRPNVDGFRKHIRVAKPALMIGHHAMTDAAQRRQIFGLLVEQIGVGAMMDLERALRTVIIAKPAPKARRRQFRQPRGLFSPLPTHDVFVVGHPKLPYRFLYVTNMR